MKVEEIRTKQILLLLLLNWMCAQIHPNFVKMDQLQKRTIEINYIANAYYEYIRI